MKQINNNTQEDYCSFEVSKLLKEKGFDVFTREAFRENGLGKWYSPSAYNGLGEPQGYKYWNREEDSYAQPTHSIAIKWIRENFNFHISIRYIQYGDEGKYYCELTDKNGDDLESKECSSPEEATEVALLYTLKRLI